MNLRMRILALVLVCSVGYIGFVYGCPDSSYELGLDFWNCSAAQRELEQATEERKVLDEAAETVRYRLELRGETIARLIEEQITLEEAVAQFIQLNHEQEYVVRQIREMYPADTEELSVAAQVIDFTYHQLKGDIPHREKTLRRLYAQVDSMRASRSAPLVH